MRLTRWYRSRRLHRLIAVALTAVASSCAAVPAQAAAPAGGLGINAWYLFWETPQSTWDSQLAAAAASGVQVVRADAFWAWVEPTAPVAGVHNYVWWPTDAIAAALARHHLQWLPIIDYSAHWAASVAGDDQSAPTDQASYAAYAAAVTARYGPGGTFWTTHPWLPAEPVSAVEIWNEENLSGDWGGAVNPVQYAQLYEAARAAVHAVSASVQAIVGGLSNPADSFLQQMYGYLGGPGKIDAVADHPYGATPAEVENDVRELRTALDSEGDTNVPIDVTEFGWPTASSASWIPTLTDAQRASYTAQVVNDLATSDCGVERIAPYSWSTAQSNAGDVNDWFGVTNNDGTPSLTEAALSQAYNSLGSATPAGHATTAVCYRPWKWTLTQVAPPSGSSSNLCVQAHAVSWSVTGGAAVGIAGATVQFSSPTSLTVTTDANGLATACWTVPVGSSEDIVASAQQANFFGGSTETVTVPIPSSTLPPGPGSSPTTSTPPPASPPPTATAPRPAPRPAHRGRPAPRCRVATSARAANAKQARPHRRLNPRWFAKRRFRRGPRRWYCRSGGAGRG